ncbi:MAG: NAD(P)-binding domain-containing protein [Spirochaetes bacterium]|nr:NAD(P)-binding domain-containing protein [Spirochaetota bacterium]
MKIAVLGTGMVGQIIAAKLADIGHSVVMGTRDPAKTLSRKEEGTPNAAHITDWMKSHAAIPVVRYAEAAQHGEIVILAVNGAGALSTLTLAGAQHLAGKTVMDITNPLDFSKGMPPSLFVCNTDSLGEELQKAFPEARIVKTLNTVRADLMVDPAKLTGEAITMFVCGNDAGAKTAVTSYLKTWFGWKDVIDLGDITSARGTEMLLPIWLRIWGVLQSADFAFRIVR